MITLVTRRVDVDGTVSVKGLTFRVPPALAGRTIKVDVANLLYFLPHEIQRRTHGSKRPLPELTHGCIGG
jgi:hypothetical protein